MYKIILDQDREKSLLRRHPWIFSKAIAKIEGNPQSGETVEIYSSTGSWLARGSYSPESQIRVRICKKKINCNGEDYSYSDYAECR